MIGLAQRKFRENAGAGGSRLIPALADTTSLPFPDGAFDLVAVAFGIRNVENLESGLREMARVCREGGRVAVLEFSKPRSRPFRTLYDLYFFRVLPLVGRLVSGSTAYLYLPKSVAGFPDGAEFEALLAGACGGRVRARRLSLGIASLYIATVRKT
jgi:demethylmenaquinone methyltransferase/2-methoxy-6-polyprenyl-1,4-benzoquinol methylase